MVSEQVEIWKEMKEHHKRTKREALELATQRLPRIREICDQHGHDIRIPHETHWQVKMRGDRGWSNYWPSSQKFAGPGKKSHHKSLEDFMEMIS